MDITLRVDFAPEYATATGTASIERRYIGELVTLPNALADLLSLVEANDCDVTNVSVHPNV